VIKQFESFYADVIKDDPSSTFEYDANDQIFTTYYNFVNYLYMTNSTLEGFIDDVNLWLCNGQISPQLKSELVSIANSNGGATNANFAKILSIIFNSSDFSVSY